MGCYNPINIRLGRDGVTRDKYGRVFEFDPKEYKRRRKNSAWPAVRAMKATGRVS
jgi:hypothetical protein